MPRRNLSDLSDPLDQIDLISTDIFDTLLFRTHQSGQSRFVNAEKRFAAVLQEHGHIVSIDALVRARLKVQRIGYRALDLFDGAGELRLGDIISRQLLLLDLPQDLIDRRIEIELEIEKSSLRPNSKLAEILRRHRSDGVRVVAISDTALSTARLTELLNHFHGPDLVDHVYSSADESASKRHGELFATVLARERVNPERVLHIGDDPKADQRVPASLGINTVHIPRSRWHSTLSRANGAASIARRSVSLRWSTRSIDVSAISDRQSFGHDVFGPIVTEFCLLIWLYAAQVQTQNQSVLLFCARGGVGIRQAFERVLIRLGLPLDLPRGNLLISRLIAVRGAVLARSRAAHDELGREFQGDSFARVAKALGGRDYELPAAWHETFDADRFFALLETDAGKAVLDDIGTQNDLFLRHLDEIAPGAKRIVLCDTGLYGSTQRLLAAGIPEQHFETIQFARSNYKNLSEEHFPRVAGLVVEQKVYSPYKTGSVVLRYWQLIEHLFEPAVPSVNRLAIGADGEVIANSGDLRYGKIDPAAGNPMLAGALQYIDSLKSSRDVWPDIDEAWVRLKRAIINPTVADLAVLGIGARSVDFGRSEMVHVLHEMKAAPLSQRIRSIKSQLWREGAIARDFPRFKQPLLTLLEIVHAIRGLRTEWRA